jgi:ribose/xylose/arabinose/galactoside ABC-type transport system permease subunit
MVTLFSVLQTFATIGLVALAVGLTIIAGEYDISCAGMFGMAGCLAVLTGGEHAWIGLLVAVLAGLLMGACQGIIIVRLRLPSVGVTLGGLLVFIGVSFVLTESRSINYPNLDVALALNNPVGMVLSIRSLATIAVFALAAFIFTYTRLGPETSALGSNRQGAAIAGIAVDKMLIAIFSLSGMLSAFAGALVSYSLASASPSGVSDILVPATAAAILGGVSLSGGSGNPLGIAAGVLTLATLRSGLNAIEVPLYINDMATGAVLLVVALLDAPGIVSHLQRLRLFVAPAK